MAELWECLQCGRKCDLEADDYCPTCGRELPRETEEEGEGPSRIALSEPGWLCECGNYQDDDFHCDECGVEPPWGCGCTFCDEDSGEYDDEEEECWEDEEGRIP